MTLDTQALERTSVRILVVDDHTLFRRGLTALLARDPRLNVVGDAADAGRVSPLGGSLTGVGDGPVVG